MEEFGKADRRLALMNRVATKLLPGSEALAPQLEEALAAIAQELDADIYLHYRTDDNTPRLLTLACAGGLDDVQLREFQHIRAGERPCGRVAQTRAPVILDSAQLAVDTTASSIRAAGARCYAGLPLLAHGSLFGTIAFASASQPGFAPVDIELLKMLADQIAAALDRAQLLQRLRDNEMRYRNAVITGRLAAWETDMATRTRIWTEEGMALFGLDLPDGRGQVGGDADEFRRSLHPDDRHMVASFHRTADEVDTYPTEYRIVRPDGAMLWVQGRGRVIARDGDGKAQRVAHIVVDVTHRKKAEEHIQLLMGEISHRSKNLLAVVQAIAGRTVRTARTLDEFGKSFAGRLQGLAASQDLLVQENWRGAPLAGLIRQQLEPYAEAGSARLSVNGPDVVLTSGAAQAIGLALNELATNAIKYGAWSAPAGKVSVAWGFDASEGVRLTWVERGGPPVESPASKGFGHIVIETMVAQSVNGDVAMDFDAAGVSWTLTMPMTNVVTETSQAPAQ